MKSMYRYIGLIFSLMVLSFNAVADVLFDTAAPPIPGGGAGINDNVWVFHRFEVSSTTTLENVGGIFKNANASSVDVFAAIVRLSSASDRPDSFDLTTPDVVGTTLVSIARAPSESGAEFQGTINLVLTPSWYAIGFGTGAFGASAGVNNLNMPGHATDLAPGQNTFVALRAFSPPRWSDQASIARFFGTFSDDAVGPVTINTTANPNPVAINTAITLTANVDDTTTGGSTIDSANYTIDDGADVGMTAQVGGFDAVSEDVTAAVPAFAVAGVHNLCVSGTDSAGNKGQKDCTFLAVYDPNAGFVTGGGWIDSPAGAYIANDTLSGKANFGFVSKYKKGTTVPTGNTEFQFKAGDLNFHSSSYDFLVITMASTNAQFKGYGMVNGGLAPNGMEYRFMIWAGDGSPDTFRIRIWWESDGEVVVYDNLFDQEIGGGSIVIHTKKK